jgi:hypothetical protein
MDNNKESIKEQQKIYRDNNKEKMKLYRSGTIMCECGCEIKKHHKSRHFKSNKHLKLLEKLKQN